MREKHFFLLNDSRLYKRETQLSYIKRSQMRCDAPHQTRRCWIGLLLMVVNESFYTVMHDILYFLTDGNIWILYKACHTVLFIRLCHVCFFPWLSPPVWPTLIMSNEKTLVTSRHWNEHFGPTFSHPLCWITPPWYTYNLSMKQARLPFPLSPLYSNGLGLFFFLLSNKT